MGARYRILSEKGVIGCNFRARPSICALDKAAQRALFDFVPHIDACRAGFEGLELHVAAAPRLRRAVPLADRAL